MLQLTLIIKPPIEASDTAEVNVDADTPEVPSINQIPVGTVQKTIAAVNVEVEYAEAY